MFINWQTILRGLIGLLILLGAIKLASWLPIGDTLKCVRLNQTCYFHRIYLWPNNNMESFKFSDVVNIYPELLGIGKGGSKFYGLRIDLERQISLESSAPKSYVIRGERTQLKAQSSIIVDRASSYLANKEAIRLKEYLASPKTVELTLNPAIKFGIIFCIALISFPGFFLLALPFLKPTLNQEASKEKG